MPEKQTNNKVPNGQRIEALEKTVEVLERKVQGILKEVNSLNERLEKAGGIIADRLDDYFRMNQDFKRAIVNLKRMLDSHVGMSGIDHLMRGQ